MGIRQPHRLQWSSSDDSILAGAVTVRAASSPDEGQIFRTVGAVVDDLYPCGREKLMAKLLANMALGDGSYVASVGSEVVAYAAESVKDRGRIKLSTFWVHEDVRRRGIGRQLLEFLVSRWITSGVPSVHVTVRSGREAELLGLFARYGFRTVAIVANRYGAGRDEVVLGWTPEAWSASASQRAAAADRPAG